MDIASRSKPCCGPSLACALQSSLNAGARLSPLSSITWFWHATSWKLSCTRGRARTEPPPHNRYVAGCTNCCHNWALLHAPLNPEENRRGEPEEPRSVRRNAFRSFTRHQKCLL